MKLPIYKIYLEESDELAIALVNDPAIDIDFLFFNKEEVLMEFDSDKRIVTGPVMIPNKLIYRNDSLGERYVYYDEDTVLEAAKQFLKGGMKFNEAHTDRIAQLDVLESYIQKEQMGNIPAGSWMLTAKVVDDNLWEQIKSGGFAGFSIESLFSQHLVEQFNKQKQMNLKEKLMEALDKVLFESEVEAVEETVTKTETKETDFASLKAEILAEVDVKIAELKAELSAKVEEFSNQTTTESVLSESAATGNNEKEGAARFF